MKQQKHRRIDTDRFVVELMAINDVLLENK